LPEGGHFVDVPETLIDVVDFELSRSDQVPFVKDENVQTTRLRIPIGNPEFPPCRNFQPRKELSKRSDEGGLELPFEKAFLGLEGNR
jgi:hypothetical protein